MKFGLLLAFGLLSETCAIANVENVVFTQIAQPKQRRQFDIGALISGLTSARGTNFPKGFNPAAMMFNTPAKKDVLEPILRKDAKRERLWFGPYTLPPANAPRSGFKMPLQMDPIGTEIARQISGFCYNCTVLFTKAELRFENGTQATVEHGVYKHHMVMVDMAKRTMPFYLCDKQRGFLGNFPADGFVVSGNDEAPNWFTTPDGAFNSGYTISRGATLSMQAELVNYRNDSQSVYVTVEYEYFKGRPEEVADSSVTLFSVTGCDFPDYHRNASIKVYNMSSARVPMPMDGYLINMKGHLHDGGEHIELRLNNETICDSKAVYGAPQEEQGYKWSVIEKMTQCTAPVKVKKGDILHMNSFYDTEKHPARPTDTGGNPHAHGEGEADEMGVFFINFAASKRSEEELKVKSNLLVGSK